MGRFARLPSRSCGRCRHGFMKALIDGAAFTVSILQITRDSVNNEVRRIKAARKKASEQAAAQVSAAESSSSSDSSSEAPVTRTRATRTSPSPKKKRSRQRLDSSSTRASQTRTNQAMTRLTRNRTLRTIRSSSAAGNKIVNCCIVLRHFRSRLCRKAVGQSLPSQPFTHSPHGKIPPSPFELLCRPKSIAGEAPHFPRKYCASPSFAGDQRDPKGQPGRVAKALGASNGAGAEDSPRLPPAAYGDLAGAAGEETAHSCGEETED